MEDTLDTRVSRVQPTARPLAGSLVPSRSRPALPVTTLEPLSLDAARPTTSSPKNRLALATARIAILHLIGCQSRRYKLVRTCGGWSGPAKLRFSKLSSLPLVEVNWLFA